MASQALWTGSLPSTLAEFLYFLRLPPFPDFHFSPYPAPIQIAVRPHSPLPDEYGHHLETLAAMPPLITCSCTQMRIEVIMPLGTLWCELFITAPSQDPSQENSPQHRLPRPSFSSSSFCLGPQSNSELSHHHYTWATGTHNGHLLLLSGQHPLFFRGIAPLTSVK